jgi:hypothetical protein
MLLKERRMKIVDFKNIATVLIEAKDPSITEVAHRCGTTADTVRRIANGATTKVEYHIGCGLIEIHKGVLRRKCK